MELGTLFKINIVILILVLVFSCKKAEDRKCFKSTGSDSELIKEFDKLDDIELHDNIKYIFFQDSSNKVVIKGGENLINMIELKYNSDSTLVIRNKNKCNFLRKLDTKITVEIHFSTLKYIDINSADSVVNRGTINLEELHIAVHDGVATVLLNMNIDELGTYVQDGFADLIYKGTAKVCNNNINSATSLNAVDLDVKNSIYVLSNTSRDIYVNADNIPFSSEIYSNGNVYFKGNPSTSNLKKVKGKGEFIQIP